jgi:hypothetical protein
MLKYGPEWLESVNNPVLVGKLKEADFGVKFNISLKNM